MIVEVFSCSGGMAEGLRRAGLQPDIAFDYDTDACDSYEKNLGHRPIRIDARDLLRMTESGWSPGEIDLLACDPPCTPWSRAGKRLGQSDERDMLAVTIDLIRLWRPRFALIANVPGLDDGPNWPIVQRTIGGLAKLGYCVDYASLDAADYGGVDLCWEHAEFAGRLSVPTTVQGTAESIRHWGSSHTGNAPDANELSVDATTPVNAANAPAPAQTIMAGKVAVSSPIKATSGSESVAGIVSSTGSLPNRFLGDRSKGVKSSTIETGTRPTIGQKTSKCLPITPSTSDAITRMADALNGCQRCRWYATPQHRIRPFWFAHPRASECIQWPERTHCSARDAQRPSLPGMLRLREWRTCRQALAHLSPEDLGTPVRLRWRQTARTGKGPRASHVDAPSHVVTTKDSGGDGNILFDGPNHRPSRADAPARTLTRNTHGDGALLTNTRHPVNTPDAPSFTVTTKGDGRGAQGACVLAYDGHPISRADEPGHVVPSSQPGNGGAVVEWTWDRPSTTVTGDARLAPPGHHEKSFLSHGPNAIKLSEKAAAVLQGFPPGWVFSGPTKKVRWAMIGQAMPPPLAEAVARSIARAMQPRARKAAGE